MKRLSVFLMVVALAVVSGCNSQRTTVTNIPTGADGQPIATNNQVQAWYTATGNLRALAGIVKNTADTIVQLNRDGVFPDSPAYVTTLQALGRAAQIELQASAFLRNQPNTWGQSIASQIRIYTKQIGDELAQAVLNGSVGIKNPDSQVMFRTLIRAAQNIVELVTSITNVVQVNRFIHPLEVFLVARYA